MDNRPIQLPSLFFKNWSFKEISNNTVESFCKNNTQWAISGKVFKDIVIWDFLQNNIVNFFTSIIFN